VCLLLDRHKQYVVLFVVDWSNYNWISFRKPWMTYVGKNPHHHLVMWCDAAANCCYHSFQFLTLATQAQHISLSVNIKQVDDNAKNLLNYRNNQNIGRDHLVVLGLLGWRQSWMKSHNLTQTEAVTNMTQNWPVWRLLTKTPVMHARNDNSDKCLWLLTGAMPMLRIFDMYWTTGSFVIVWAWLTVMQEL